MKKITKYHLIIIAFFMTSPILGQLVFEQGIVKGGITAAGFSTGQGAGSGSFDIYMEPGSAIKKAYAFTYRIGYPPQTFFSFNGNSISFDTNNVIMNVEHVHSFGTPIKLYFQEITSLIGSTNNTITIFPPTSTHVNWGYWSFFIYVVYENATLPITCYSILINDKKLVGNESYVVNDLMPININHSVNFSLYTDRTGVNSIGNLVPNSNIYFNNFQLGTIGGSDNVNNNWDFGGVKGHFYYQNNHLYGLDDDTPDVFMNGTDGLADVSTYLASNATSCNFRLTHIEFPNQQTNATNINLAYFLTYTTPCSEINAVVSNDTTVCEGEELQLFASGGTKYEWLCLTDTASYGNSVYGLSCKDCPNPVFSGNRSAVYTVRVWNGDSCSVVRPVRITVKNPPTPKVSIKETTCGNNDGYLIVSGLPNDLEKLYVITPNGDTLPPAISNTYLNLGKGTYSIYYTDVNGCKSKDTTATIESVNMVKAIFTATPLSGPNPLAAQFTNNSQYAAGYSWSINGQPAGTSSVPDQTVFDSSGVYQVQLVAIGNSPECTDTVLITILVYDSLVVEIPNVFSPNNDGVNDVFAITTNQPMHAEIVFFNRWGNEIFSYDKDLNLGSNVIWNGTSAGSATVTDGVYFYKAVFSMDKPEADCNEQKCELEKSGFVHIVR